MEVEGFPWLGIQNICVFTVNNLYDSYELHVLVQIYRHTFEVYYKKSIEPNGWTSITFWKNNNNNNFSIVPLVVRIHMSHFFLRQNTQVKLVLDCRASDKKLYGKQCTLKEHLLYHNLEKYLCSS